jgi:hypothetical protein
VLSGARGPAPMLAPLFGFFFGMIAVLTGAVVLLTSFSNISMIGNARQHPSPPVIGRTVAVEIQRHPPPVVKEEAPAKDASPVVHTAKMESKKSKHYKPKVVARHPNNYGYGNARGYASGYGPSSLFFR